MGRLSKFQWVILAITTCGTILRVSHLFSVPFNSPFHLGGLFYEFSRQIILNNFVLPETIPYYSLGGIPFAYPPLGFYIQAIVMKVFTPPAFVTVNLLPPLIAVLSLPAFYWMVKAQTGNNQLRIAALFAFAVMPSAFVNQIEGAGLAEACGTVALILYMGWLIRFEKNPRMVPALWTGIFLGFCILSSPGSAYAGVIISFLYFFKFVIHDLKTRTHISSFWLLVVGLTGLLVSMPYWLTIIQHREIGGFTITFLSQQDPSAFLNQIRYMITFKPADMITFVGDEGIYGFLFDWLVFGGLIWFLLKKQGFQVLVFFSFWLIPREGSWLVAIPAAWLAANGMVHLVWPVFQNAFNPTTENKRLPFAPGLLAMILIMLMVGGSLNALHDLQNQPELIITPSEIDILRKEQLIIPVDAHILVAGNGALREWSPALLEREVLNCEFGLEWQPDELRHVFLINAALDENDLVSAMSDVKGYSGDSSVWLVGDTAQIIKLMATANPSLEIAIQYQTPELVFATIQTRVQSWLDRTNRSHPI
jgi:4-amino-4-deoxy-L-arabinose transferase-like glycosyltransferase